MLSGLLSDELEQEAIDICSDLSREAGYVNKKSLKVFISDEVMHQSLQGRLWGPEAQENTCVRNRGEAQVDFFFSFDINLLARVKLISWGPSILHG